MESLPRSYVIFKLWRFFKELAMFTASAFTTVMASKPIPSADEHWRSNFLTRVKILQKSFYLLSLVLVTSTVTILLLTSLPLDLLTDGTLKAALNKFINGITAFWGGLFTATLFATFAPAVFLFIRHALVVRFIKYLHLLMSLSGHKNPAKYNLIQAHVERIIVSFFMKRTTSSPKKVNIPIRPGTVVT